MRPEDLLPELFPGATGATRMRLLGLLAIVLAFQGSDSATPAGLAARSGRSVAAIRRDLRSLAALDLVERVRPRGTRASRLRVKENAQTKRLLAVLMRSFDLQTG
jgi:DeoR/GlpR family transcriptional regulator of sugar metabolism